MAVKYVKDFAFDSGFGFSGSSGKTPVRAYMRGGAVKSNPTKAPSIAPAMVEKRSQGLGGLTPETKKLAAYDKPHVAGKKGAKVAQYAEGGSVVDKAKLTRTPTAGELKALSSKPASISESKKAEILRKFKEVVGPTPTEAERKMLQAAMDAARSGYAKGGKAKKEMPSFLKAKMMKKANGGPVNEIIPGDGMSPLQMMQQEDPPLKPLPPDDPRLLPSLPPGYEPPPLAGELEYDTLGNGKNDRVDYDPGNRNRDFLRQLLERDTERMRGDAAQQMRDLDRISRTGPGAPEPIGELMPLPEEPVYARPAPRALDMVQVDDMIMTREDAERMRPPTSAPIQSVSDFAPKPIAGIGPMMPGAPVSRLPMAGEPGFGTSQGVRPSDELRKPYRGPNAEELAAIDALRRQTAAVNSGMDLQGTRGVKGSPLAEAARMAPQDRRAMRADRNEMAREIMDRYIAGPRRAMPTARRAMPVAPSEPMIKIPRGPRGGVATFAKGGKVSKGEKKIGKVMGEFKRGELHSGSKKGPIVTNPKQATAIALSEARAAGAKIPKKKAMGGKACG